MQKGYDKNRISWKAVKDLAQILSASIIVIVIVASMISHPSEKTLEPIKEEKQVVVKNRVENQGSSATLNIQSAKVVTTEAVQRQRVENATEESSLAVENDLDTEVKEKTSDAPASGKNRVVNAVSMDEKGGRVGNRVIETPKLDKLVSKLFENYGQKPEISDEATTVYQYPVELGYAMDSNYDGKLFEKIQYLLSQRIRMMRKKR